METIIVTNTEIIETVNLLLPYFIGAIVGIICGIYVGMFIEKTKSVK